MPQWSLHYAGRANSELRIGYGTKEHSPQYAALHTNDSYLRLSYGPQCEWGTSIVTMPVFWSGGKLHQGIRVSVEWAIIDDALVLTSTGQYKSLQVFQTITLRPPVTQSLVARVEARTSGNLKLDSKPGEAFKPVFLSSMRISDLDWDCRSAFLAEDLVDLLNAGFIGSPGAGAGIRRFGLLGGTSRWKKNSPTITIELDEPMAVNGWVTRSNNPNGDNVGLWAASDAVLPSWSYTIRADAGFLP